MEPIKGDFTSRDLYESGRERQGGEQRKRFGTATKRRGTGRRKEREVSGATGVKVIICLAVCFLCLAIKLSDSETAQKASSAISSALTYDINLDESIGRLKFVQKLFPGTTTVFGSGDGMRYPISGNVSKSFEEMNETGIEITGDGGAKVVAAMDGTVQKRGKNQTLGNYLRISHSGGIDTYYYNLKKSSLEEGAEVTKGQEIAELGNDGVLVFEVHVRGNVRNPMSYLGKN